MESRGNTRKLALRAALVCVLSICAASALPAVAAATTGISGKVTEAEAPYAGIKGVEVCLYSESYTFIECETGATDATGEYTIEPKGGAGTYRVGFSATGFASQYWDDVSSLFDSTAVTVTSGKLTENIDAALEEEGLGSLTGRVTNASNGEGAGGVEVCIYTGESHCHETNANGEYSLSGLRAGNYDVYFSPAEACEEEQGEKIRCQPKSDYIDQSVPVRIKAERTETLNVALGVGGQISGTVTNASITHPALAKVTVCALKKFAETEEFYESACGYTNSSGQYTISGLESGPYKVEFNGYICSIPKKGEEECPEVYITAYAHGQQTAKKGETVNVTTGSNTSGVNESLREAFPTTPASTGAPTLTGTPAVGKALSCSPGSWSHEPTFLAYQWLRNGTVITGQSGSTYTLQVADQGKSITCVVWAGNGAGVASATSNAVAVPVPLAVFASAKVKGTVASVVLRCPGPGSCSGTLKFVVRMRHGKRTTNVTVGTARFSIAAGKSATVRVPLTAKGRSLFGKAGKRGLKVTLSGTGIKGRAVVLKPATAAKKGKKKKK